MTAYRRILDLQAKHDWRTAAEEAELIALQNACDRRHEALAAAEMLVRHEDFIQALVHDDASHLIGQASPLIWRRIHGEMHACTPAQYLGMA